MSSDEDLTNEMRGLNIKTHPDDDRACFVCRMCVCNAPTYGKKKNCRCRFPHNMNTENLSRVSAARNFGEESMEVLVSGVSRQRIDLIKEFKPEMRKYLNLSERYKRPSPIQKAAVPILLANKDLVAVAQTGSGKTAAYLIPMLFKIMKEKRSPNAIPREANAPYALIIVPKRELTSQVYKYALQLCKETDVICTPLYGGVRTKAGRDEENRKLRQGNDIIISTPGRIASLAKNEKLDLQHVRMLIIDEADTLLMQNYGREMQTIREYTQTYQTAMFCAVLPQYMEEKQMEDERKKGGKVERRLIAYSDLLKSFLKDHYVFVSVGITGSTKDVQQEFVLVENPIDKPMILERIIRKELTQCEGKKIMVFVETRRSTADVASRLCKLGFPVTVMHSLRSQADRELALYEFNEGIKPVLVCTSVCAHGLDIPGVDVVVNYDLPQIRFDTFATYIYRIGRAGRAGNAGRSISMVCRGQDEWLARPIVAMLAELEQTVPEWLDEMCLAVGLSNVQDMGAVILATHYVNSIMKSKHGSRDTRTMTQSLQEKNAHEFYRMKVRGDTHEVIKESS